jgi:hypothetical protein
MSVAKAMKLKEYGTDIISHDSSYQAPCSTSSKVRMSNTFKSNVLASTPLDVPE